MSIGVPQHAHVFGSLARVPDSSAPGVFDLITCLVFRIAVLDRGPLRRRGEYVLVVCGPGFLVLPGRFRGHRRSLARRSDVAAHLPFEDGEIPDMRWYVGRYPESGNRALFFECQHLQEDGTCGAYDRRPAMCKNFACQALRGEQDLDEFLEATTWGERDAREELEDLHEVTDRVQEIIEREVTLRELHDAHEDAGWQEGEA